MATKYEVYDSRWATEAIDGGPDFAEVASGGMNGCQVVVRCGGPDDGSVYFLDADQRSLWPDEQFRRMFPGLDPLIAEYLERRQANCLPAKPEGYEGVLSRVVFGESSGGGLLLDAIDEDRPFDDLGQQRRSVQRSPTL